MEIVVNIGVAKKFRSLACDLMIDALEGNLDSYSQQLNKCNARCYTVMDKQGNVYRILQSYKTVVAIIYYLFDVPHCVSFARIAYGKQTSTTTQHIHKFMKRYSAQDYVHD